MNYQTILLDKSEGIATITLNQPKKRNVISHKMMDELLEAFRDITGDNSIRVAILTASGDIFSAGVDIREHFAEPIGRKRKGEQGGRQEFFSAKGVAAIMNLGKPIIAAINGPAVGLGCTICLACDMRLASKKARLNLGFVRLGLTPEFGSTFFLPRLIGLGKSLELLYTGRMVEAEEAKEIGLVNEVVPAEKLGEAAQEMAQSIAKLPPLSIKLIREGVYLGAFTDINTALKWEHLTFDFSLSTGNHEEAVKAFLGKRNPSFQGK